MKKRDLVKTIEKLGFWFLRSGGRHDIYTNGDINVAVPRHNEINEITARAIIKICKKG